MLIDADGKEVSLTSLTATSYTSEWSYLHINKNVEGGTLKVDGQSYTTGLGMNAECTLIYDLPAGHNYKTFKALCGYDSSCDNDNMSTTGTTMEFLFYATQNPTFTVDLTQFGYGAKEEVPVYDIWAKESVGTATGSISTKVASHGTKLYRLGDAKADGIKPNSTISQWNGLVDAKTSTVYSLTGTKVGNSTDDLKPGFYISNGKKYFVK